MPIRIGKKNRHTVPIATGHGLIVNRLTTPLERSATTIVYLVENTPHHQPEIGPTAADLGKLRTRNSTIGTRLAKAKCRYGWGCAWTTDCGLFERVLTLESRAGVAANNLAWIYKESSFAPELQRFRQMLRGHAVG